MGSLECGVMGPRDRTGHTYGQSESRHLEDDLSVPRSDVHRISHVTLDIQLSVASSLKITLSGLPLAKRSSAFSICDSRSHHFQVFLELTWR